MSLRHFVIASVVLCSVLLQACVTVGPDHKVPESEIPEKFKNQPAAGKVADHGDWWKLFKDPQLTKLLKELDKDSVPNIASALARRDRVRAQLGTVRSAAWPTIRGTGDARRNRDSQNSAFPAESDEYSSYELALTLDYEIDLWGRIRRRVEGAEARSAAADALLANAMLSLRAELARNYFALRSLDEEIELLRSAAELREQGTELIRARAEAGQVTDDDLARAEAELESTRGDLTELQRDRDALENVIAAFLGKSPSTFTLRPDSKLSSPPVVPAGLPSELLERRADVAEKERLLAAACADFGVAIAEFLPRITLTGAGGVTSLQTSDLFNPASKMWDIGPKIEVPIFRGGLAISQKAEAKANLKEARATYQQTVLDAFRDVENGINANRSFSRESSQRVRATAAAARASEIARARYRSGLTSFLEVLDALRTDLANQRLEVQTRGDHFQATVALVQALGGGWKK